jgi:hypothetical protein
MKCLQIAEAGDLRTQLELFPKNVNKSSNLAARRENESTMMLAADVNKSMRGIHARVKKKMTMELLSHATKAA